MQAIAAMGVAAVMEVAMATEPAGEARWDGLILGMDLVTLADEQGYGVIPQGALGWRDGVLQYVGTVSDLPSDPDQLAQEVVQWRGHQRPQTCLWRCVF